MIKKIKLAFRNIQSHALKSFLTILGIVFGVASVVAMLSISEGARRTAIEKIKRLGTNNIIINSVKPEKSTNTGSESQNIAIYGIETKDYEHIKNSFFGVSYVIPVKEMKTEIYGYNNKPTDIKVMAVIPEYMNAISQDIEEGRFIVKDDIDKYNRVCVLQNDAKRILFSFQEPIGKIVQIKNQGFQVVGVLEDKGTDIYIPYSTAINSFGNVTQRVSAGARETMKVDMDQVIITVKDTEEITDAAERLRMYFSKTHEKNDYEIKVPLELLKQEEATQMIFKIVMSSIAGISLIVGGIGIMNIMLANIRERTKEIGTRRALGARKKDILIQFLTESVILTNFGGIIGIITGIGLGFGITRYVSWPTVITPISIFSAFFLSTIVGVVFGTYPAYTAAKLSPIEALRTE